MTIGSFLFLILTVLTWLSPAPGPRVAIAQENLEHKIREQQFQIDQLIIAVQSKPEGASSPSLNFQTPAGSRLNYASFLDRIQNIQNVLTDLTDRIERIEFQMNTRQQTPVTPLPSITNNAAARPRSLVTDATQSEANVQYAVLPELDSLRLPWNQNANPDATQPEGITDQTLYESDTAPPADARTRTQNPLDLNELDLYERSLASLQNGDVDAARQGFRVFLDRFSETGLASNAYYWLAETYYARQGFAEAASLFLKGYQTFPEGSKAAASLFKLGMSLLSLGKKEDACTAFGLVEQYQDGERTSARELAAKQAANVC